MPIQVGAARRNELLYSSRYKVVNYATKWRSEICKQAVAQSNANSGVARQNYKNCS